MSTKHSTVYMEFFQQEKLCDAVITAGNVDFKVHRIILCGCSPYFRELFTKYQKVQPQVYSFPSISPSTMRLILEYAYTCSVMVTEENVLELLVGADCFAIKGIIEACCDLLEQKLCHKNCIDIWKLTDHRNYTHLKEKAYLHMLHHFEEVAALSSEFLQLSVEELGDLIERDELNVKQESIVFEAIVRWINYAPEERGGHIVKLLSKVRLLLMSPDYLVGTLGRNDLVRNSPPCQVMVKNILKALHRLKMERPLACTRLPYQVLMVIGSWDGGHVTELYNVRTDCWMTVNIRENTDRKNHSFIYLNGFIYCVGGTESDHPLTSVERFCLATHTWQEVGSMHDARSHASVAVLNGCIYTIGGFSKDESLKTAERYNPETNQWTVIAPMHKSRSNAGAAALHGKVYVCGGESLVETISSAECYNPDTDQWTLITLVQSTLSGAVGVIAYDNKIYIVGGHNEGSFLSTVTTYDPKLSQWCTVAPMSQSRSKMGVAVLEDQLYVVGGKNSDNNMRCVERYDRKTKTWDPVHDMESALCSISCCVVERNPYIDAFLAE